MVMELCLWIEKFLRGHAGILIILGCLTVTGLALITHLIPVRNWTTVSSTEWACYQVLAHTVCTVCKGEHAVVHSGNVMILDMLCCQAPELLKNFSSSCAAAVFCGMPFTNSSDVFG